MFRSRLPDYTPAPADVAYVWYRDGKATGVTAETYVLALGDKGKKITVKVTASLPEFITSVLTSLPTSKVIG